MNDMEKAGLASGEHGGRMSDKTMNNGLTCMAEEKASNRFTRMTDDDRSIARRDRAVELVLRGPFHLEDASDLVRAAAKIEAYLRDGTTGDDK